MMKVYLRECLWLCFYCATAPTASEAAKQLCEMAALRVCADDIVFDDYITGFAFWRRILVTFFVRKSGEERANVMA